jgi:general secretion pathway protein D
MRHFLFCLILAGSAGTAALTAQTPPAPPPPQSQPEQTAPAPAPPVVTQPQAAAPRLSDITPFELNDASLPEMIRILARRLKINYILDPSVKGSVTIYTYGEIKAVDEMPLLETILRINGFAMVQVGDLYRIVPVKSVSQLPLDPTVNADPKTLPADERMILNLVFLKYANAAEIMKLLQQFLGEGAQISTYDPANLLLIEDNSRSMKRTMDLISMFDSDTFAGQRVKLFDVSNSRPSDLVKELESVFKAYALSDKASSVKFIPVDRVNTLIAVAPNPGIFVEVKNWIDKLDIAVKTPAGSVDLYYYRLKYGRAETVAMAIMAVLTGNPMAMVGLAAAAGGGISSGASGYGGGSYGNTGYGNTGYGNSGYGNSGYGNSGYGNTGYGNTGYGNQYAGGAQGANQSGASPFTPPISTAVGSNANPVPATGPNGDLTGAYLGLAGTGQGSYARGPSVIPNPFDNTILVRSTPQEWAQIQNLLRQIDVPPRQVLIVAKIYELQLNGSYTAGLQSFLDKANTGPFSRALNASGGSGGLAVTQGLLVGHALELLGQLNLAETNHNAKVIAAPSIIATDSVPAVMNVGQDVPVLTSQGVVGGVASSGTNVFGSTVSNRSTGTTLSITARINSSGVVTMMIDQDVSAPLGATTGGIGSPSFSRRSFSTQVTVQDGDTVAIGGFIQDQDSHDSNGIPGLNRIPLLGAIFGSKSVAKARDEVIVFLTPRVIYDTNQMADATDEIKSSLKKMQKMMRDQ